MLIQVTVNNPDDQDVAPAMVGLLYQLLTILALYLRNMLCLNIRSKQPMILKAILIPLILKAHQYTSKLKYLISTEFQKMICP